jgi:hypothetical protein
MLTSNDLLTVHKASCEMAEIRRDIAADLKKGIDPLVEYEKKHSQPFGNDLTFIAPSAPSLATGLAPTFIEVNHSGEDFVKLVNEVKRTGNAIRKTKNYEPGSPEDLYHRGELRKGNDDGRFLETGR